ncbi:MAG: FAD-binding protein [Holdemania massiliensis]
MDGSGDRRGCRRVFYYFPNTLNSLINYANYFVVDKTGNRILNVNALYGPRSIAFADAMERTGEIFSIFTEEGFASGIEFIETNNRIDDKTVYKADTLEELAQKTGMDPQVFADQVDRYNDFCAQGVDDDLGQTTLIPIHEGPYYAVSIKTITMGTIGGLKTMRIIRWLRMMEHRSPGCMQPGN